MNENLEMRKGFGTRFFFFVKHESFKSHLEHVVVMQLSLLWSKLILQK